MIPEAEDHSEDRPAGDPLPSSAGVRLSVVAIDDDAMILRTIGKTLAAAGMACRTAVTGREGLALLRQDPPDLVLLDIGLPGDDGFAVCREIRRSWSAEEMPVVMVTGLEDLLSIQAAYQAGANDYLTKPLHWKHLPYRIRHVLDASRALRDLQDRTRTLHSLFAAHPDPIFTVDADGAVTLEHAGVHGRPEGALPFPGGLPELLHGEQDAQVKERCRQALAAPGKVFSLEIAHLQDGEERCWEGRFVASAEDKVLVMIRDITERKSFER